MQALVKSSGDILFGAVLLVHLVSSPYAKVEESFNLHAVHDILERGLFHVPEFDHLEFPGVVPRTFLGPLAVSALAWPGHFALKACPTVMQLWPSSDDGAADSLSSSFWCPTPGISSQILARACLGFLGWLAFRKFRRGIALLWGDVAGVCFGVVCSVQFHLPYYLTRTLPNTMALVVLFYGYGAWFECAALSSRSNSRDSNSSSSSNHGGGYMCIGCMVLAAVLFRCDVLVVAAPAGIAMLVCGHVNFWRGAAVGVLVGALSLCATVSVDSWLWQRWLWPEGEVLFFNTVANKSSEWGTMPAHWYFASALPRALLGTAFWLLVSFSPTSAAKLDFSALPWFLPAIASVALYSFLPHKELRFIFPALPLLNAAAARGLAKIWSNLGLALADSRQSSRRNKGSATLSEDTAAGDNIGAGCEQKWKHESTAAPPSASETASKKRVGAWAARLRLVFWCVLALGPLVASCLATTVLACAAQANYPGGHAFAAAHDLFAPGASFPSLAVHIDAAAAMAGVSRFGERHRLRSAGGWQYSKAENLTKPEHFVARAQPGFGQGFDLLVTAKDPAWFLDLPPECATEHGATPALSKDATPPSVPASASCAATFSEVPAWAEVHVAHGFSGLKLLPLRDWLSGLSGRMRARNGSISNDLGWLPVQVITEPMIRVLASRKLAGQLNGKSRAAAP